MHYKVLALDLDGTMTNTEKVITPRTKGALQVAAGRGVCLVLASGRPTVVFEPLAR
ncbi:UNVERIFIED_CONTAM: HAD hydrolase family protein, partial [Bacteroidetes bacterium 56_B9]